MPAPRSALAAIGELDWNGQRSAFEQLATLLIEQRPAGWSSEDGANALCGSVRAALGQVMRASRGKL
jgi:hypothetical protein